MKTRLQKVCTLTIEPRTGAHRVFVCSTNKEGIFLPLNKIMDKSLRIANYSAKKSDVKILNGPVINRLTHNQVLISIDVSGIGLVTCTLYELPITINLEDISTIVSIPEERDKMRRINSHTKRSLNQRY
jgi:hypothetical protein